MKRVIPGFVTFLVTAPLASAALLLNDSFNYPDGPLATVSTSGWAHHSGSVTGQVVVVSGRVLLCEDNGEDVNAPLAGQPYPSSGATNVFTQVLRSNSPRSPAAVAPISRISKTPPRVIGRGSGP